MITNDTLTRTFLFLDQASLNNASQTCKNWNRLIRNKEFFKDYINNTTDKEIGQFSTLFFKDFLPFFKLQQVLHLNTKIFNHDLWKKIPPTEENKEIKAAATLNSNIELQTSKKQFASLYKISNAQNQFMTPYTESYLSDLNACQSADQELVFKHQFKKYPPKEVASPYPNFKYFSMPNEFFRIFFESVTLDNLENHKNITISLQNDEQIEVFRKWIEKNNDGIENINIHFPENHNISSEQLKALQNTFFTLKNIEYYLLSFNFDVQLQEICTQIEQQSPRMQNYQMPQSVKRRLF